LAAQETGNVKIGNTFVTFINLRNGRKKRRMAKLDKSLHLQTYKEREFHHQNLREYLRE
jgi:hypothetical protein